MNSKNKKQNYAKMNDIQNSENVETKYKVNGLKSFIERIERLKEKKIKSLWILKKFILNQKVQVMNQKSCVKFY